MLELILREWRLPVHERPSVMFVLVCAASAYALLIGGIFFLLAFIEVRRYVGTDTARMATVGS